nr:flavin reductase family protein [Kineosphaera limosa]
MGRFATGVTVVTTHDAGQDHAMTANSLTSVSLDPLLVLVCVETESRFHDAVLAAGVWGVSVLAHDGRAAATWLATRGRPLHGQLDRIPHHRGPLTGVPLLTQALATLECRTRQAVPAGDHVVLIADVLAADLSEHAGDALLYYRGRYRTLD